MSTASNIFRLSLLILLMITAVIILSQHVYKLQITRHDELYTKAKSLLYIIKKKMDREDQFMINMLTSLPGIMPVVRSSPNPVVYLEINRQVLLKYS